MTKYIWETSYAYAHTARRITISEPAHIKDEAELGSKMNSESSS
jgi:hypothetical protein